MSNFSWLHISDIHIGIADGDWLWPTLKQNFIEDIRYVVSKAGAFEAVVFSGDLTQRGTSQEFQRATSILQEIWAEFASLGFEPKLVCVPGNHDLIRPNEADPAFLLLRDWLEKDRVRRDTFDDPESIYRRLISSSFENYTSWKESLPSAGIPLAAETSGLFPGDFSASIEVDGEKIGFVGLNSAWLAFENNSKAKLEVNTRQLLSVTAGDPGKWAANHAFRFLVTHHPTDWLHTVANSQWKSEISPPGRFHLHLYGHMHLPDVVTISHGGSKAQHEFQASSLLGLERINSLNLERTHGYAVAKIDPERIEIWPRSLQKMAGGHRKFTVDHALDLPNGRESFSIPTSIAASLAEEGDGKKIDQSIALNPIDPELSKEALQKIRLYLLPSRAAQSVRRVEQRQLQTALETQRCGWLVAEWGSGSDQFLWSIQTQADGHSATFRLDLQAYSGREQFFSSIKQSLNHTFGQFCEALSDVGPAYLILDDVPVSSSIVEGAQAIEADIEEMTRVILEFCPQLRIILRTRRFPVGSSYPVISLKSLDEADLRVYVAEHERGGAQFLDSNSVSALYRYTDGVPARIDGVLRELEVTSINNLSASNSDMHRIDTRPEEFPRGLPETVMSFESSTDSARLRSFHLLRALAAFPQGESIENLKRFYGKHPLFPSHARDLLDSSLIVTRSAAAVGTESEATKSKLLVVPRPVRDFVRSHQQREQLQETNALAANLYFGEKWREGALKKAALSKFRNPAVSAEEINNAGTIILRLLVDSIEESDERAIGSALDIAERFLNALHAGDHFRSVVTLCREIIPVIPEEHQATGIKYLFAQSLRMTAEHEEARDVLETLREVENVARKQGVLLNLALVYQSLHDPKMAVESAREAIKLDKTSSVALQAKAVILDEDKESPNRKADLLKHEALCRRRNAHLVANNLVLDRLKGTEGNTPEAIESLDLVIKTAALDHDFYNLARATIKRVRNLLGRGVAPSARDKSQLIAAYHFLFSERFRVMFDDCHDALWQIFERENATRSLFGLFRHSSLIWRLRGNGEIEKQYLNKLAKYAVNVASDKMLFLDRERSYYLVRVNALPNS